MAQIGKKKPESGIRVDPDFKAWVENLSRTKAAQEKDKIHPSRITQAIYKQYLKYPYLELEIKKTKLGKWQPL